MNTAILIPNYSCNANSYWLLEQCLKSIERYEPALLPHTFVLDDESPDPAARTMLPHMQRLYGFKLVWKKKNTSYSDNINLGMRLARQLGYEQAVTLNNDVELKAPFSAKTRAMFQADPLLSVIGGLLFFPDGRVQHQGFDVNRQKEISHPGYRTFNQDELSRYVSGVTGAFQVLHLERVTEYPSHYPLSYEDVTFCLRQWEQGKRAWYERTIGGIHHESATRGYKLGPKEMESLKLFRNETFDWESIEENLRSARSNQSAELLPAQLGSLECQKQ